MLNIIGCIFISSTSNLLKYLIKLKSEILKSGSLKTYLPLAIGELILIVIGIYLAFQAENWREERKEERELKEYLNNLSQSIEGDLIHARRFRNEISELSALSIEMYENIVANQLDDQSNFES